VVVVRLSEPIGLRRLTINRLDRISTPGFILIKPSDPAPTFRLPRPTFLPVPAAEGIFVHLLKSSETQRGLSVSNPSGHYGAPGMRVGQDADASNCVSAAPSKRGIHLPSKAKTRSPQADLLNFDYRS